MQHAGFFWKLWAACAAPGLICIVALSIAFLVAYRSHLDETLEEKLATTVDAADELLEVDWQGPPDASLQDEVRSLGTLTATRLTVIRADGQVLADSYRDDLDAVIAMENHGRRPEIIEAKRSGVAGISRASAEIGERFRYHAIRVDDGEVAVGYVRASIPEAARTILGNALNATLWTVGVLLAVVVILAAYLLASRLTAPIRSLTSAASAIAAGNYDQRLAPPSLALDEISVLARAVIDVGARLATREQELRQTSQTQATVLEGMTESVVAVDQSESILFANEAAGRVLGFGPRDVQGRKLLEVVRSHELRNSVRSALESRTLNSCDLSWRSDTERTFQVLATPLPGEPCPGVVVVLRDVTELKRLEGMRQQFVANVSHELKTPLSSIKAYTETLLSGAVRDPQHGERFLQRIDEQANRLHQLIMDLLSLARIESGQAALEISPVSVIAVVQQCLTDFEPQASGSGIDLKNGVGDLPLLVSADEESLRLILGNLIDNAIKYTPAGGSVAVSARQATDVTVIEVADTGIGIAAADHQRLFERFYRVDKARSRELGGTGLGLSIVKHLSQAMGGSVAVRSELGRGSVFSVILPNVES